MSTPLALRTRETFDDGLGCIASRSSTLSYASRVAHKLSIPAAGEATEVALEEPVGGLVAVAGFSNAGAVTITLLLEDTGEGSDNTPLTLNVPPNGSDFLTRNLPEGKVVGVRVSRDQPGPGGNAFIIMLSNDPEKEPTDARPD